MTNFSHGREAETAAAEHLRKLGYKVVAQNWRTRQCEVDVVATQNGMATCVEVKYRLNNAHGSGLEYITPKKQQQMSFAAEIWAVQNKWKGDITLGAIEVSGENYEVTKFIESIF